MIETDLQLQKYLKRLLENVQVKVPVQIIDEISQMKFSSLDDFAYELRKIIDRYCVPSIKSLINLAFLHSRIEEIERTHRDFDSKFLNKLFNKISGVYRNGFIIEKIGTIFPLIDVYLNDFELKMFNLDHNHVLLRLEYSEEISCDVELSTDIYIEVKNGFNERNVALGIVFSLLNHSLALEGRVVGVRILHHGDNYETQLYKVEFDEVTAWFPKIEPISNTYLVASKDVDLFFNELLNFELPTKLFDLVKERYHEVRRRGRIDLGKTVDEVFDLLK